MFIIKKDPPFECSAVHVGIYNMRAVVKFGRGKVKDWL